MPLETIETRVRQIICDELRVDEDEVTAEANFTDDLGADSLDQAELVMAFEEAFDFEIPSDDAERIVTVAAAVDYIKRHAQSA